MDVSCILEQCVQEVHFVYVETVYVTVVEMPTRFQTP